MRYYVCMHVCRIHVDSVDTRYVCKKEVVSVQDRTELRSGEGCFHGLCDVWNGR